MFSQLADLLQPGPLPVFATSLAIGLLIGLERERSPAAKAGLRTFALTALLGTVCGMLANTFDSPWLIAAGLLAVAASIISAYQAPGEPNQDPGTTTHIALLLCYGLGILCWIGERNLAVVLAITTTILLYFKTELSGIAHNLTPRDVRSMLQFAVLSLVILPVLPNQDMGPYNAFNPYQTWLMVVLISGVSLAGYVALRLLGEQIGASLLGLLGGLVSSTVTTLIYARQAKENRDLIHFAAVVVALAHLMIFVRLTLLGAATAHTLLVPLATTLGIGLVVGLLMIALGFRGHHAPSVAPNMANPAELKTAISFALLYSVVLLTSAWLQDIAGSRGLYVVALASGLTDVDAITLSSMRLYSQARLSTTETLTCIVLAITANTVFKLALTTSLGGWAFTKRIMLPMLGATFGSIGALAGLVLKTAT
ncbi:MgtC/SapB family protein [Chitinivorax sp. B]|uniref:MgtC/SapB family protein n=1 Tax=Chitinivorax sp. B TaxID=2502235 RepID=UPI0010F8F57E|nr:MgtC/SapB family protein [Chitinivorax sp. B]